MSRFGIFLVLAVLGGCVGYNPRERGLKDEAAAEYVSGLIEPGRTTRSEAYLRLGRPSSRLDDGRALLFRLGSTEGGKVVAAPYGQNGSDDWEGASHSVVVLFDERGVVRRYAVVSVRGKIDVKSPKGDQP